MEELRNTALFENILQGITDPVLLLTKDNGKGITKKHFLNSQSFGIMGIRERVNFFGGNVKITGIKDKGTTIMVSIPLKKKEIP